MDNKKLSEEEKEKIRKPNDNTRTKELVSKLENDMINVFIWESTEEGHSYWAEVRSKLRRIAEEGY